MSVSFMVLRRVSASHPPSNGRAHTLLLQLMLPLLARSLLLLLFSQRWRPVLTDVSTPCRLQFVGRTPLQLEPASLHPTLNPAVLYLSSSQSACLCELLPSSPHNCLLVCPCVSMEVVSARLFGLHLGQDSAQSAVRASKAYTSVQNKLFRHPGPIIMSTNTHRTQRQASRRCQRCGCRGKASTRRPSCFARFTYSN